MSSEMPERRDIQSTLTAIQVDVATIKERTLSQGKVLEEMKTQIGGVVFREEYDRRHAEVIKIAEKAELEAGAVRDDYLRRQGAERVWKAVFSGGLALLGVIEAILHH